MSTIAKKYMLDKNIPQRAAFITASVIKKYFFALLIALLVHNTWGYKKNMHNMINI